MPELSRFYGIIICMYCELEPHHSSHFRDYHGDDEAVYGLDPIELLAGSLPRRQARLVEAWAELDQSELVAGCRPGQNPCQLSRYRRCQHD